MTFTGNALQVSPRDWEILLEQRAITAAINKTIFKVGATFLKPLAKEPFDENWSNLGYLDTDLQRWIDDDVFRANNVGFNLQQGLVDVDIDSSDPAYNSSIVAALAFLNIDTRFRFGRRSFGVPTHLFVQIGEEEAANFDELKKFEPQAINYANQRHHVQLRSYVPGGKASREAKQTVVSGSIYQSKSDVTKYDISVWWTTKGAIARHISEIATTTPRNVNYNELVRAISFGTILYLIKPHWIEGSRQMLAYSLAGWLVRLVQESSAHNNHEKISHDVYCPIDTDDIAESLLRFICDNTGDSEYRMRVRTFHDARDKLARNPDARIPGWPALERQFGAEIRTALRAVCMPGTDTSALSEFHDDLIFNRSAANYILRHTFESGDPAYVQPAESLYRRYKNKSVLIKGKPMEAFRLFEVSKYRQEVDNITFDPNYSPGTILLEARGKGIVDDDYTGNQIRTLFNQWAGFDVQPVAKSNIDANLMRQCHEYLVQLLKWLTRDNMNQVDWMRSWVASIVQYPGVKLQIAPVIVGGQGIGKSMFGTAFMRALLGNSASVIKANLIGRQFSVGPFINKLFVLVEEPKFTDSTAVDELKIMIRNVEMGGEQKGFDAQMYNIYARLMLVSNRIDMNIGQSNIVDRALYYMRAYDNEFLAISPREFNEWAETTVRPFAEMFINFLKRHDVKEHYMRYFNEIQVDTAALQSSKSSASSDPAIVRANMNPSRKVAVHIVEHGWIIEDSDLSMPFTDTDLFSRVKAVCDTLGMRQINGQLVLDEFNSAGVLRTITTRGEVRWTFKWKTGTLLEKYGAAIDYELRRLAEKSLYLDHYGENDADGSKGINKIGARVRGKF